jgi:hypothetical protein
MPSKPKYACRTIVEKRIEYYIHLGKHNHIFEEDIKSDLARKVV